MRDIYVTETSLPPLGEYEEMIAQIWKTRELTNQGQLLKEFESKLREYLGVPYLHFVSNGTIALQLGLQALVIQDGEVITTPFSYVATCSSILWQRCTPVFVDIDPDTLTIDPKKIEEKITSQTKAILPVHVFGYMCDVEAIEGIANKHGLKVIYDAAHGFGLTHKNRSAVSYGDISTLSFHATKLFHTIEGGCVIVKDQETSDKIELTKRFGHNGDNHIMLGINAKANEFQAAMGLCNLRYISDNIAKRKKVYELYDELLDKKYVKNRIRNGSVHNYSYYPIIFSSEQQLLQMLQRLKDNRIFPRRYFYPSLNTLPYLATTNPCPVAEDIACRIVCLPLSSSMEQADVTRICKIINRGE